MSKKKDKVWLFIQYKKEHPEKFPKVHKKKSQPVRLYRGIKIVFLFVLLNGCAIGMAAVANHNIMEFLISLGGGK